MTFIEKLFNLKIEQFEYLGAFIILYFTILKFFVVQNNENALKSINAFIAIFSSIIVLIFLFNNSILEPYLSIIILIASLGSLNFILSNSSSDNNLPSKKNKLFLICFLVFFGITIIFLYSYFDTSNVSINVMLNQVDKKGEGYDPYDSVSMKEWEDEVIAEFEKREHIDSVNIIPVNSNLNNRLKEFIENLESDDKNTRVDVFAIDHVWVEKLSTYAEDLSDIINEDDYFKESTENNKVKISTGQFFWKKDEEKTIAIPWYIDVGLLFYRKDLLGDLKPPTTWKELEDISIKIQTEQRNLLREKIKINEKTDDPLIIDKKLSESNFYGFIWEYSRGEGLNCIAYELAHSYGAKIVDKLGKVSDDPRNVSSITSSLIRAQNWLYDLDISPGKKKVTDAQVLDIWKHKNALFMRHWPVAYNISINTAFSNKDNIGISIMPVIDENVESAIHASTLGGWQLMINKNSDRKKKKVARDFVKFLAIDNEHKIGEFGNLSTPEYLTQYLGKYPAIKEIYANTDVRESLPDIFRTELERFKTYEHIDEIFKPFPNSQEIEIIQRPSRSDYAEFSKEYQKTIYTILTNKEFKNKESKIENEILNLLSK